jgi:hypothetical protein
MNIIITCMLSASRKRSRKRRLDTVEVETDSGKSDNGWVHCRRASKHHLPRYGDPILVVGATFLVSKKHSHKFLHGDDLDVGKIHSVVRRHGSNVPFFKFYNLLEYPEHPPPVGSASFMYHQCDQMMSTDEKRTGIKWTARSTSTTEKKKRVRKQYFETQYGVANRGLYDKEDGLDVIRRKKRQEREESEEESESSAESSSSDDDDEVPTTKSRLNSRQVSDTSSSSSESESDSESERDFTSTKVTAVNLKTANYWIAEER